MARKWNSLFNILRSLKVKISQMGHWRLQRKKGWSAIALALLTLCLVVGTSPVLSQTSSESSTCQTQMPYEQGDSAETASSLSLAAAARSLETMVGCWERQAREAGQRPEANSYWRNWAIASVNLGRLYAELGQQARACETLTQALGLSIKRRQSDGLWIEVQEPNICENEDLPKPESEDEDPSPQSMWEIIGPLKTQNLLQANSLRILGDVLRTIGQLDNSHAVLQRSRQIIDAQGDSNDDITKAKASVYLSLGNTYRAKGNLERDRRSSPRYDYMPWCFVKREKFEEAETYYQMADAQYQSAIKSTSLSILRTQARLNSLSLILDRQYKTENQQEQIICPKVVTSNPIPSEGEIRAEAQQLLIEMSQYRGLILENLSNGQVALDRRAIVYSQINLAKSLAYLQQLSVDGVPSWDEIEKLIQAAIEISKTLDEHTLSYALGHLGSLYEYCSAVETQCHLSTSEKLQRTSEELQQKAKQKTEEALYLAQPSEAPDIAYQWQWQMGRLLNAQGERERAIAAYQSAVTTLKAARSNLLTVNTDVQFSFRDNIEPVYRELVTLLLKNPNPSDLELVIEQIDALQLAELENFLQCSLAVSRPVDNTISEMRNEITQNTIFIYPIILKNSLEIIYKLPGQPFKQPKHRQSVSLNELSDEPVNYVEITSVIRELQNALGRADGEYDVQQKSQQLYSWLIKPLELDLVSFLDRKATLVFILDGELRNIPMSILYDADKHRYLIKDYAVSVISSRTLFESRNRQKQLKLLLAGISKEQRNIEGKNYSELKAVRTELAAIQTIAQSTSDPLLDEKFVEVELEKKIDSAQFPIVHIATHGNFTSDPEETFILAWGKRIKLRRFEEIIAINNPSISRGIDLLVLSACETAQGDRRAVLGLAGVAARAKVRSIVATLWQVNDERTAAFISKFYEELKKEVTIAEALRNVQVSIIDEGNDSPYFWAPFVLVGNWT